MTHWGKQIGSSPLTTDRLWSIYDMFNDFKNIISITKIFIYNVACNLT